MADAARAPVREGVTTLEELDRVLGERAEVEEEAAPGGGEPMILIVDDDSVNRTLGRTLLHKSGYRVSEAVDGVVALEKLAGPEEYALMVLDLDMPRLSGLEVLKQVRSNVRTAGLPVVVLTGTREEDAEIELMEAGADDYIRKPIDPPRFVARVKAALRRAGVEAPPG
jgi:DNA-binding response OmpR family regulator